MPSEDLRATKVALVVTTINAPSEAIRALATGAKANHWQFIVVGDRKSPSTFECENVSYFSLDAQRLEGFRYAEECPIDHYARKNIGYLIAIRAGAEVIVETDDDNVPRDSFWAKRARRVRVHLCQDEGWTNVYRFFSDELIWPRGLPLDQIHRPLPPYGDLPEAMADCVVQQGLADENPDVDAVYRLLLPLPQRFLSGRRVALTKGCWCPFNSQNTTWWRDAYPLLYLPAYCSFRMTDIWRSFVAQRIAWSYGWCLGFHEATVWQRRNAHDLMRDFADEVPGYLNNSKIVEQLASLNLEQDDQTLVDKVLKCYTVLAQNDWIDAREIPLLEKWLDDVNRVWQPISL